MSRSILTQAEQWPERCAAAWEPDFDEDPRHTDYNHLEQLADHTEGDDYDREHPPSPEVSFSFRHPDADDDAYHLPPTGAHGPYHPWLREHELTEAEEAQHERSGEDQYSGYNWGPPPQEYDDPGFAEEETDDWPDPDHMRDYREAKQAEIALEPDERLLMRDPSLIGEQGHTYPDLVGGDPPGAVSVQPREEAGPHDAFLMPAEESGLGYDAIVRRNPAGDGWDVIRPWEKMKKARRDQEKTWANGGYSGTLDDQLRSMSDEEREVVYRAHPWLAFPGEHTAAMSDDEAIYWSEGPGEDRATKHYVPEFESERPGDFWDDQEREWFHRRHKAAMDDDITFAKAKSMAFPGNDDPDGIQQRERKYDYATHGPVGVMDKVVVRMPPTRREPIWRLNHGTVTTVRPDGTGIVRLEGGADG